MIIILPICYMNENKYGNTTKSCPHKYIYIYIYIDKYSWILRDRSGRGRILIKLNYNAGTNRCGTQRHDSYDERVESESGFYWRQWFGTWEYSSVQGRGTKR